MGKYLICGSLFLTLIYSYGHNYWFNSWYLKWWILLTSLGALFSYFYAKKIHWSVGPFIFSFLVSGLLVFAHRDNQYQDYALTDLLALKGIVAYASFVFVFLLGLFSFFKRKEFLAMFQGLGAICVVDSIYVFLQACMGKEAYHRGGFIGNASMNSSLIAFTYPFAMTLIQDSKWGLEKSKRGFWVRSIILFPIFAIFLPMQSVPIGIFFLVLSAFFLSNTQGSQLLKREKSLFIAIVAIVVFGMGFFLCQGELLNDSGRFSVWRAGLEWFWNQGDLWLGQGPGVSQALLPSIQEDQKQLAGEFFLWWHSDVLQLFFEQGILGLASFALLTFYALKKAFKTPLLFAALCGYIGCSFFNYPAHLPLHALAGFTLFMAAFQWGKYGTVSQESGESG